MAWDFATEPEFEEKLEWMRGFVRDEIFPLETLELDEDAFRRPPIPEAGGEGAGPVGRAPAARARGRRLRPGEARPDARDPGRDAVRAGDLRQQRARLRQRRAARRRRQRGAEGALDAAAARRRAPQRVLDDRARHRRLRPHAAQDARGARRRRVGDQRPQVVHVERLRRRLPDRHGRHQPRRAPVPGQLDDHRAHRHAGRRHRARRRHHGAPRRRRSALRRPLRDHLPRRARALREPGRQRGRRLRAGPAAPGPRPHPPLHALAGPEPAGLRHAVRARRVALHPRLAPGREADDPELGRRLGRRDAGGPADDAARRLEDGHRGCRRRPASRSP